MNKFIDLVLSRRSLREYDSRNISEKDLELCMEAARHAPSACNSQEWKFIAVNRAETKKQLCEQAFSSIIGINTFVRDAAAFIVLVTEAQNAAPRIGQILKRTDFTKIDIGIACEHIVLQAQDLGIGSCIIGWFNEKALKNALGIPGSKKVEIVISLGYPPEGHTPPEKKLKDPSRTISFNRY